MDFDEHGEDILDVLRRIARHIPGPVLTRAETDSLARDAMFLLGELELVP